MVIRGTEFAVEVRDDDTAVLTLFDGEVELRASDGRTYAFASGDVVTGRPGEPPRKTAAVTFGDWTAIQWALYYPAILDPEDLGWPAAPDPAIASSWNLYLRGNLPRALAAYPADRVPASPEERLYLAALLLAVGNVDEARQSLDSVPEDHRLAPVAAAHRRLIATVLRQPTPAMHDPASDVRHLASGLLAESYRLQVEGRLPDARDRARAATERSPGFGFAWVRLAELEFSLGNTRAARRALDRGVALTPDNAEAHALRGFVLAAGNRIREARRAFQTALELDPALGNAWLGRGLCRIRQGDLEGGRADLLMAAAAEPPRALLRSYLAKSFVDSTPFRAPPLADKAGHELDLARRLDPNDPTPWLYSALLHQQANRVNAAIADLERSVVLNTNRYVYRSEFLLDQDQAVRSANLAALYADAGMSEPGVREATRAVNLDYANASAHLFLANSYNALRDPRQINLRYEAPWLGEFLLASLLAPVGGGALSQTVSQQEYAKLFQRDGFGVVSDTLWTSNGDWLESAAQVGQFGNFEYAFDALYRSETGQRPNNDLEQLSLSLKARVQLGLADTVFLQGIYHEAEAGDVEQYYDPAEANPYVRTTERHEPLVLAGWHHEWKPGVHTLLLLSPWSARATVVDPANRTPVGYFLPDGSIALDDHPRFQPQPLAYATRYTGFSAELQQLWQAREHTFIGGVRWQTGAFDSEAALDVRKVFGPGPPPVRRYDAAPGLERFSVYAYDQWQVRPWALVTAGVAWDRLEAPFNFTLPPLAVEERATDQVSPNLGLTLTPWKGGVARGAYTRSLGGVSFDQSYRLEPVQVAGFTQTYRGLLPESLVGLVPAQEMETWGVAFEQRLPTRTWLAAGAEVLESAAERGVGAFLFTDTGVEPGALTESLEFRERSLFATAHQLVGDHLALGVSYRLSEAELERVFARVPDRAVDQRSVLHRLVLSARFHHPGGFFARWDSTWSRQSNTEDVSGLAGDEFWQHDFWAGWRFRQRRAELALGVLNLTDQDYRLYPLNYYPETYRERTFAISARFNF
jgi:tetratricopeptide (TPR) repeat protein